MSIKLHAYTFRDVDLAVGHKRTSVFGGGLVVGWKYLVIEWIV